MAELELLDNLSKDRDRVVTQILKLARPVGKQLLHEIWMGKKENTDIEWSSEARALLTCLANLGRLMRWIAQSYFTDDDLEHLRNDPRTKWFEGSASAHMYQTAEAYCLRHWKDFILQKPVSHITLAYDGVRLGKERINTEEDFSTASAKYIADQQHDFQVHIREKKHRSFLQLLNSCNIEPIATGGLDAALDFHGNSGSAALWHMFEGNQEARVVLLSHMQENKDECKAVTFLKLCEMARLRKLRPYMGTLKTIAHAQLLLATDVGKPITFALWLSTDSPDHVMVGYANWERCIPATTLQGFFAEASDKAFMASFLLENSNVGNYPARALESSRSSVYDDLLSLQTF